MVHVYIAFSTCDLFEAAEGEIGQADQPKRPEVVRVNGIAPDAASICAAVKYCPYVFAIAALPGSEGARGVGGANPIRCSR